MRLRACLSIIWLLSTVVGRLLILAVIFISSCNKGFLVIDNIIPIFAYGNTTGSAYEKDS